MASGRPTSRRGKRKASSPTKLGAKCGDCPFNKGKPVLPQPRGSAAPKLIVCGEAPGRQEEEEGRYFVGPTGQFVDTILDKMRIPKGRLHLTNACMCRPSWAASPSEWRLALECCRPRLVRELKQFRARTVLAYGKWALCQFTGRQKPFEWAGAPLSGVGELHKWTVLPTLHPAFALRPDGWSYKPVLYVHTERAWQLANKELPEWEWPPIFIEPDKEALDALKAIQAAGKPVGFDVETRGTNPLSDLCMCLGVANEDVAVSVPWQGYTARGGEVVQPIGATGVGRQIARASARILGARGLEKVCQNGPHDILTANALGLEIRGYTFDTMYAHSIIGQGRKHDLGWICCEEFHAPRWKEEKHTASNEKGAEKFSKRDPRELRIYNAKDAYMTVLLKDRLGARLDDEHNGWDLLNNVYMPNVHVAMKMQVRGFKTDPKVQGSYRPKLMRAKTRARWELRQIAKKYWPVKGAKFNPSSNAQLKGLFFGKLRVRPKYFSQKTGAPGLPEGALTDLLGGSSAPAAAAARALLRYRKWGKLLSTYINGLPVDKDKLIHSTWKPSGAKTMRWSSSPNLQNIPKNIRDFFVSHSKDGWIVRADYDQLELRLIALLAGDQPLIDVFNSGADPHAMNASDIFGVPLDQVTGAQRSLAKMAVYQMNYGGDPTALWRQIIIDFPDITLSQCHRIHNRWFARHWRIREWHEKMLKVAYDKKYIEAPLSGHRLYFFGRVEDTKIYNYPVQHSAADVINPTIPRVADALDWKTASIVAQVHDELVLEGPDPVKLGELLRQEMTQRISHKGQSLEFSVGLKIGRNWKDYSKENPLGCVEIGPGEDIQKTLRLG